MSITQFPLINLKAKDEGTDLGIPRTRTLSNKCIAWPKLIHSSKMTSRLFRSFICQKKGTPRALLSFYMNSFTFTLTSLTAIPKLLILKTEEGLHLNVQEINILSQSLIHSNNRETLVAVFTWIQMVTERLWCILELP